MRINIITKKTIFIWTIVTLLLILVICALPVIKEFVSIAMEPQYDYDGAKIYEDSLVEALKESDTITVEEVFDFEFSRAFLIEDTYLSGDSFAKKYGLDISVEEMMENNHENCRRIVFVDDTGEFVYEFRFLYGEPLSTEIVGLTIYPETIIKRVDSFSEQENSIGIEFLVEQEDYLIPYFVFDKYKLIIDEFSLDLAVEEIYNEAMAEEQAKIVFKEKYGYVAEDKYKIFRVYYNKSYDAWLVKANIPSNTEGGVPSMIVKSGGQVLAVWRDK